uniref:Uncharacterized protein n=1 Tax=Rhipicephalus microplus TaxID=6941 RepID=A0A6G5AHQ0_RHIMP
MSCNQIVQQKAVVDKQTWKIGTLVHSCCTGQSGLNFSSSASTLAMYTTCPRLFFFSTLLCLPLLSLKVLVAFCIAHFLFLYNIHIYMKGVCRESLCVHVLFTLCKKGVLLL